MKKAGWIVLITIIFSSLFIGCTSASDVPVNENATAVDTTMSINDEELAAEDINTEDITREEIAAEEATTNIENPEDKENIENIDDTDNTVESYTKAESTVQTMPSSDVDNNQIALNPDIKLSSDEDTFILYLSGIDVWGSVNTTSRSDVNILAIVNMSSGKILLVNTPRDYYVPLPVSSGACDKLTHAGIYGVNCSIGAMESLYGVDVDYYVRMNFSGFESIINTMGGIDVYSEYTFTVDPIKTYQAGYNHLTGLEALAFVRERHAFPDGDNQRGKNQMEVIKAMVTKLCSKDFLYNYSDILSQLSGTYQTDMPASVIYDIVSYQLGNDINWQIETYSVTGSGSYEYTYSVPGTALYVMLPNQTSIDGAKSRISSVLAE